MSDNKLLAENTIRRFMKLANVESMTDNFVNEKYGMEKKHDDEELKEEEEFDLDEQEEPEMDEEPPMPEPAGEEEEMEMDMGDMDPEAPEPGAADMSLTEEEARLLIDLGDRLSAAMEGGEPEMDAPEMEEPEMEEPEMDGEEGDMADELAPEDDEPAKAYMESVTPAEQQRLISEILKRVTKRLVAERRK